MLERDHARGSPAGRDRSSGCQAANVGQPPGVATTARPAGRRSSKPRMRRRSAAHRRSSPATPRMLETLAASTSRQDPPSSTTHASNVRLQRRRDHAAFEASAPHDPPPIAIRPPGPAVVERFADPARWSPRQISKRRARSCVRGSRQRTRSRRRRRPRHRVACLGVVSSSRWRRRLKRHGTNLALNVIAGTLLAARRQLVRGPRRAHGPHANV